MSIMKRLTKVANLFLREIFGFISPSVDLSDTISEYEELIDNPEKGKSIVFERKLSNYIGGGEVISFASGRMAFYALLKTWGIGKGDEVALTGFTCSVMVNAVLRVGATPVYVDIDPNTLGMSPKALSKIIGSNTKVVVAQHTFGIPCEIDTIKTITQGAGAFLIEDCALSLGSSYKGIKVGNWGDAAIFSTDHTKPLNTLIGGFAYTNNKGIAESLRLIQQNSGRLSNEHQNVILRRYLNENRMENKRHNIFVLQSYWLALKNKIKMAKLPSPYLHYEASTKTDENDTYPYPAQMPPMIAAIGVKSLEEYLSTIDTRKKRLRDYLSIIKDEDKIPKAYYNTDNDIIPLRFAFFDYRGKYSFVDDWVWFKQPIVASSEPLENFGYLKGMCPNSEATGQRIMNLPILINEKKHIALVKQLIKNK